MSVSFLGIDTSNYTTSAALLHENGISASKRMLCVGSGERGLRQSDAVFQHVKNLPEVLRELSQNADFDSLSAIGVSDRPRDAEDSYMPCFLAGRCVASSTASVTNVPLFTFSHQAGHIAAVLYGANRLDLLQKRFLAFHISGGTTEAVLVTPDEKKLFRTEIVARSLDLKAGQAIDRVGTMMGLSFPCGAQLDRLAVQGIQTCPTIKATMKNTDCCLSGIENRCRKLFAQQASAPEIAAFCILSVVAALEAMLTQLRKQFPELEVVFSGGVSSNSILRERLAKYGGIIFSDPALSTDNAVGIAVLTQIKSQQV